VAAHLDEIDRCFPFFLCMLGESYGWIPDDYYRDYGQLDEPRFSWIKTMPDSMSLVHLEIVHAYFRKKLEGDSDDPGGGRDDDFCLFYFRDKTWMNDPTFITDHQVQTAKQSAERRLILEQRAKEAAAAREMEEMSGGTDPYRQGSDYIDVRIMQGFDLGYWLDQQKGNSDDRKKSLRKEGKRGSLTAANILKKAGGAGLFAAKVVVGGLIGGLAYGAYKGGGAAVGFIKGAGGRKATRLSKKHQHKEALRHMSSGGKKKKEDEDDDTEAMYSELLKKEAEEAAAAEVQESAKSGGTVTPGKGAGASQGTRAAVGVLVDLVLPISFDNLDDKVKQSCAQVLSKYTDTQGVEVDEIEPQSGDSVKAVFWVPAADHAAGKKYILFIGNASVCGGACICILMRVEYSARAVCENAGRITCARNARAIRVRQELWHSSPAS